MKRYKIHVGGNPREIKRVLSVLFKLGYVFTPNRVRTMENVERLWSGGRMAYWDWVVTGYDEECKAMLCVIHGDDLDYKQITLDEFLKLNL